MHCPPRDIKHETKPLLVSFVLQERLLHYTTIVCILSQKITVNLHCVAFVCKYNSVSSHICQTGICMCATMRACVSTRQLPRVDHHLDLVGKAGFTSQAPGGSKTWGTPLLPAQWPLPLTDVSQQNASLEISHSRVHFSVLLWSLKIRSVLLAVAPLPSLGSATFTNLPFVYQLPFFCIPINPNPLTTYLCSNNIFPGIWSKK